MCSTTNSQPFVSHESHGHSNQTVCSYESCVFVTAWLNVLRVIIFYNYGHHITTMELFHDASSLVTVHGITTIPYITGEINQMIYIIMVI